VAIPLNSTSSMSNSPLSNSCDWPDNGIK
jgi:hypothetical protein